jgi:hypothetical protein
VTVDAAPPPPAVTLVETRAALQALAEHVLCAARHRATGRIGLRSSPGGFATPPFPSAAGDRTVRVDGRELVVVDDRGERRAPIETVRAAAELAEVEAGAPTDVFTPTTSLDLDAHLAIDDGAASFLAAWWARVDAALAALRAEHVAEGPTETQLWPEHFDIAASIGEVNYGGSPGDGAHPMPYLYVGPWSPPEPDGGYWNQPFGALVSATAVASVDDALAFFRDGRERLDRQGG